MAHAETQTKLPLDTWAKLFGLSPLHFNQVIEPNLDPGRSPICAQPWLQHQWQSADKVSREEIASAISEAEAQIEDMLGFHLLPTWDYDEWRRTARPYRPELVVNNFGDVRGMNRVIELGWKYFISGGTEAVTDLGAQAVSFVDNDGDGYNETASCSLGPTSAVSDPSEIEAHLPSSDYDEGNRIRPLSVRKTDNGDGTFSFDITFRREQVVRTQYLEKIPPVVALDGSNDAFFYDEVQIWRHYNAPATQATLMWERGSACGCSGTGCSNCVYSVQTACLLARQDPKLSMVSYQPADWDATNNVFTTVCCLAEGRDPDVVRAYYRSGWQQKRAPISARYADQYPNQVMDPHWARVVAHFAASKLDRPICDCGPSAAQVDYWAADLAYSGGSEQLSTFSISQKDLDNPFGTKRGAVMAWKAVDSASVGRAVLV